MAHYFYLILILSFSLAGDSLFNVAIIWQVLAQGGSAKTLGLFLCLIMVLTFILQETSGRFKNLFQKDPRKAFALVRAIGVICSLIFLLLLWKESIVMLYVAGMVFSVLSFLTMITVEATMGQEVLQGRLRSNKASRILQTAIQISAFLGASIAGFVLSLGGMKGVLVVNATTYASGALFFLLLTHHIEGILNSNQNNEQQISRAQSQTINSFILWSTFIGLAILMVQISAFNFLVPLISLHEKVWTATQFGYIDAAAGLGAFLCTFVMAERGYLSQIWVLSFVGILVGDSLFHFLNNAYLVAIGAFFIGFFANSFRIKLREFMYEVVSNTQEILVWTGRITAMSSLIKALAPLVLAFITFSPSFSFMLCGFLVSAGFMLVEIAYFFVTSRSFKRKVSIDEALTDAPSR